MARAFAVGVGSVLVVLGVVGLLAGEGYLFGVFNVDLWEDVFHLLTGGALLVFGWGRRRARGALLVVGLILVFYGALGFAYPKMFVLLPDPLGLVDNLLHLAVGIACAAVAEFSGRLASPDRRAAGSGRIEDQG